MDLHARQRFGNRAVALGGLVLLQEESLIDLRHLGLRAQVDPADGIPLPRAPEAHPSFCVNALRGIPVRRKSARQRHRKAASVRRTQQLLGVRARTFLHSRAVGVSAFEGAASQPHCAFAVGKGTVPRRISFMYRHRLLLPSQVHSQYTARLWGPHTAYPHRAQGILAGGSVLACTLPVLRRMSFEVSKET